MSYFELYNFEGTLVALGNLFLDAEKPKYGFSGLESRILVRSTVLQAHNKSRFISHGLSVCNQNSIEKSLGFSSTAHERITIWTVSIAKS